MEEATRHFLDANRLLLRLAVVLLLSALIGIILAAATSNLVKAWLLWPVA
ncbi:hypothetical protein IOC61_13460 [Halomonas sp. KAO]|nr:hypothetical protein [Halomonas sp. KAO]MBF7054308.1 hypothetical protein [Halomonas sp. KAO]